MAVKRFSLRLVLVLTLSLPVGAAWGRRGGPARRAAEAGTPEAALQSLLDAQVTAWNRGDIEGFMDGYWKSEKTTFAGASGVSRGWQALLERYRRTYPDRAAMGTLTFSDLEITLLGRDAAFVLGRWHLERASGPVGGVFSLVVRKFPDGWRIIHDHTSVVESAPK